MWMWMWMRAIHVWRGGLGARRRSRLVCCAWSRLAEHGHDRMGPTPMSDPGAHATTTLMMMMMMMMMMMISLSRARRR